MQMTHEDEAKVIEACKTLAREHIGDFVYTIRERLKEGEIPAGKSAWEAERVKEYSRACVIVLEIAMKYGKAQ